MGRIIFELNTIRLKISYGAYYWRLLPFNARHRNIVLI